MVTGFVDSSVLIDVLRSYAPAIMWIQSQSSLGVSSPVWMELMVGSLNKEEQANARKLLAQFTIVYLNDVDQDWTIQQVAVFGLSHGVGVIDCQIASISYRMKLPLYTRNVKHFIPLLGELVQKPY